MIRRMKRNRVVLYATIAVLCLLLGVSFIVHTQCLRPSISYYQILRENIAKTSLMEPRTKTILLYTNFFDVKNWKLSAETVGPDYFRSLNCPVTDCVLTNNRHHLDSMTDYDALVFHIAEPWAYSLFEKVPALRTPSQIYVAANMESPAHTKHLLEGDANFFNWTMTYRLDSDVVWNYNNVVEMDAADDRAFVGPSQRPQWRRGADDYRNETLEELARRKDKMAAQFVSHCDTFSGRDELVKAIQRLMPVDVYGKCGTMECPRGSPRCARMLTDEYRFYFAFENSLCRDYVTEKLYNAMDNYIIPVVFGGVDYSKFVPPHSVIDVQQFATVEGLVDYLKFLADNPEEYVKYFWWKEHYRITGSQPFCELCRKLHDIGTREKSQHYRDIKAWWFDGACQARAKIEF
ncbi:alpha-(1,3)-fucosyltransferase C isoform X1 [Culex quinquefasciatus]|uniref:alpha-(1,3)-fucosyltransferase C isoform X1 n=1 Tax=Culex quinquefasciatus TaxID=7176 RepID=UPI0018E3447B|nr:alpha-(1,3)-fucosyltransferase C isoform X1 [Culex quinquefasciatus]